MINRLFLSALLAIPMMVSGIAHSAQSPKIILGIFSGPSKVNMTTVYFHDGLDGFSKALGSNMGIRVYPEMYQSLGSIKTAIDEGEVGMVMAPAAAYMYAAAHGYTPVLMSKGLVDDVVLKNKSVRVIKTATFPPKGSFLYVLGEWSLQGQKGVKITQEMTQGAIVNGLKYGTADIGTVNGAAAKALMATGKFEIYKKAPPMPSYTLLIKTSLLPQYGALISAGANSFSVSNLADLQLIMAKPVVGFTKYDEGNFASFKQVFKSLQNQK